jgi:hypothetical protein
MTRIAALAVVLATVALLATPAVGAAPSLTPTVELKMEPKTGVKRPPRGMKLTGRMSFASDETGTRERPIITGGRILLPRGIVFNGARYPTCTRNILVEKGPTGCPRQSIVGSVSSNSWVDQLYPAPQAVLINGGPRRIWAYTTLYRPTLVKEPVAIRVTKPASRQWSHELRFTTPANLRIVAGVPIVAPAPMRFSIGGTANTKRYLTYDGSCPRSGSRRFVALFDYWHDQDDTTGTATARGRLACR